MKPSAICWIAQRFYEEAKIADLLVAHNICPLLDSSYSREIWVKQGVPETMRYYSYLPAGLTHPLLIKPYLDECISATNWGQNNIKDCLSMLPDLTIGETSTETIQQLVDAGCKNITLTVYGLHLFSLFGINFRLDCISQIYTWDRIMKKHPDKFHFNWLMIDQLGRAPKLVEWCRRNGNTIGLVAPDKWNKEMSVEEMYNKLKTFINILEK